MTDSFVSAKGKKMIRQENFGQEKTLFARTIDGKFGNLGSYAER